jgi:hypothetical protein
MIVLNHFTALGLLRTVDALSPATKSENNTNWANILNQLVVYFQDRVML